MATNEDIRSMDELARQIVNDCAEQVYQGIIDSGSWLEEEGFGDVLEQSVLALILAGLIARAERKGIAWASIRADAEIAVSARAALPHTDAIQ